MTEREWLTAALDILNTALNAWEALEAGHDPAEPAFSLDGSDAYEAVSDVLDGPVPTARDKVAGALSRLT